MVATVVVFMWWWTTENWDWASAELKPPRTVRLSLETAAEFAEVWTVADCQLQILELEQRVTALEERTGMLEEIENQIHSINPPLRGLSSPDSSPDTETPAEQGSTKTLSYSELFPASQGGTPKP
jgi:hypothetical protein